MAAGGLTKGERVTLEAHEAAVQSEHQQAVNSLSQSDFHRSMVEWGESSLANRAVQLGIENLPDPQSSAAIRRLLEFVGGSGAAATVARWKGAEYTLTSHAETQMIERGLTVNQVERVMSANSPFHYWWEGQLQTGWYDAGSRTFIAVVPNEGIVRTVMTDI